MCTRQVQLPNPRNPCIDSSYASCEHPSSTSSFSTTTGMTREQHPRRGPATAITEKAMRDRRRGVGSRGTMEQPEQQGGAAVVAATSRTRKPRMGAPSG